MSNHSTFFQKEPIKAGEPVYNMGHEDRKKLTQFYKEKYPEISDQELKDLFKLIEAGSIKSPLFDPEKAAPLPAAYTPRINR